MSSSKNFYHNEPLQVNCPFFFTKLQQQWTIKLPHLVTNHIYSACNKYLFFLEIQNLARPYLKDVRYSHTYKTQKHVNLQHCHINNKMLITRLQETYIFCVNRHDVKNLRCTKGRFLFYLDFLKTIFKFLRPRICSESH